MRKRKEKKRKNKHKDKKEKRKSRGEEKERDSLVQIVWKFTFTYGLSQTVNKFHDNFKRNRRDFFFY
jgi:hypothetical protein